MNAEERLALIKQVGEEIVTEQELRELLSSKSRFIAYDGFEPSGKLHIAQGIMRSVNVNKIIKSGGHFKMLVADWHGWANNKLGGNLGNIQTAGKYMVEVWKACGMDLDNVEFIWASDLVKETDYWKLTMQIARNSTVKRIVRCAQIMGRKESESLSASQILYPCMQCADIFYLKADVTQLGTDQRKVNVLARELAEKLGYKKPVIVSHHMLMGLSAPVSGEKDAVERAIALKMAKSRPETAIFMTDTEEGIKNKISRAYCPAREIKENPLIEYSKYLIFEKFKAVEIKRPEKFGGNLVIEDFGELENLYKEGKLHPADLKNAVAFYLNELIEPVRNYFEKNQKARKLKEEVEGFEVTR